MTGRRPIVAGLAAILASLGFAFSATADTQIFRYVAPDGSIHYANAPMTGNYRPYATRSDVGFSRLRSGKVSRSRYYPMIDKTAREHQMDPALIRAVVKAESDYNPQAVSSAGALGLMQLMPGTAQDLAVRNPFDPEENVRGGVQYLRYLLTRFNGDTALALAAYHAGEQRVERHNGVPPIEATKTYVKRVLNYHKKYRQSMPDTEAAIYRVRSGDAVHYTTTPPVEYR
ncbi:MAG: lytic transglycosylase domain-containing protein [Nitrospirota bacterium]